MKNDVLSIAVPAICCGIYGYPVSKAVEVALDATCDFLSANATPQRVVFALFSPEHLVVYERALEARR